MLSFELEQKLRKFGRIEVGYDVQLNTYSFQNKWASEISSNEFKADVLQLKSMVLKQLAVGKNTKSFLVELKEILGVSLNIYEDKLDKANLEGIHITKKVPASDPLIVIPSPLYTNENGDLKLLKLSLLNVKADETWADFVLDHITKDNDALVEKRFEQIQLLFAFDVHHQSLIDLYQFLDKCELSEPYTDFSKLASTFEAPEIKNYPKCHSMLSKIDMARLFDFLVDQEIVFFGKGNPRENNLLLYSFLESTFTYYSTKTRQQEPIVNINKSFSEIKQPLDEAEKIKFVDDMILRLQKYKG